jgi:hypothetical protein
LVTGGSGAVVDSVGSFVGSGSSGGVDFVDEGDGDEADADGVPLVADVRGLPVCLSGSLFAFGAVRTLSVSVGASPAPVPPRGA